MAGGRLREPIAEVKTMMDAVLDGNFDKAFEYFDIDSLMEEMKKKVPPKDFEKAGLDDPEKFAENMKEQMITGMEIQKDKKLSYEITGSEDLGEDGVRVTVDMFSDGVKDETSNLIMKNIDGKWKMDLGAQMQEARERALG